jgi:hypothetical protein
MAHFDEILSDHERGERAFAAEAERILSLAEELDRRIRARAKAHLVWSVALTLGAISVIVISSLMMVLISLLNSSNQIQLLLLYGFPSALVVISGIFAWTVLSSYKVARAENQNDMRIMLRYVDLLREVEKAIADHEHLSALERAQFRIRLSQFGIGSSAD